MSLEIRNNMISRMVFDNKSLVMQEELELEEDDVVENKPEPAVPGILADNLSNDALIANFLGKPLSISQNNA